MNGESDRMVPTKNTVDLDRRLPNGVAEHGIVFSLVAGALDAIARHSRRGWRIDKPSSRIHIDAIIALCMALDRVENQPELVRLLGWLYSPASTVAG